MRRRHANRRRLYNRRLRRIAARVEDRINGLNARKTRFGDDIDWDATSIVFDGDDIADADGDFDVFAISGEGFVD